MTAHWTASAAPIPSQYIPQGCGHQVGATDYTAASTYLNEGWLLCRILIPRSHATHCPITLVCLLLLCVFYIPLDILAITLTMLVVLFLVCVYTLVLSSLHHLMLDVSVSPILPLLDTSLVLNPIYFLFGSLSFIFSSTCYMRPPFYYTWPFVCAFSLSLSPSCCLCLIIVSFLLAYWCHLP